MQYVDQPRTLDDLSWWKQNMNFDAVGHLEVIDIPVLGQWGGSDIITPAAGYREKFEQLLSSGRNAGVTTRVYPGADHRLEVGFGENGDGQWHWFGIADGVLEDIEIFIRDAALR